ncbi:MAG: murein hydrolase activator EnvC family protein [Methyloligellaceae bacterium]
MGRRLARKSAQAGLTAGLPGGTRLRAGFRPAFLVLLCLAGPAALAQENVNREDAARQLERQKKQLDSARERAQTLSRNVAELAKERAKLNELLIETARRIQEGEARLSRNEDRLVELAEQEKVVRGSIDKRKGEISKLLSAMQRIGRHPPPALVTRRDDALKMVRSAMLMASIFPELKYQADNLSRELDGLVRLQSDIAAQRDKLKTEGQKLATEKVRIKGLLVQKKKTLTAQEAELTQIQRAAKDHAKTVTYLGELLKRMDKELKVAAVGMAKYEADLVAARARDKLAAEQAKQLATPNENVIELKPERRKVAFLSPSRIKPAVAFASTKGLLPLPAQGRRTRGFGKADKFGGKSKGISLQTRVDAQVTSPSDGWVAYAGEFRSYGQLLIINAGGGYHILLAGMRQIDVSLGQFVLAGEPVAVMGAAARAVSRRADKGRPVLYIEFRKDGQPIDPDPWWAEGTEKVQG